MWMRLILVLTLLFFAFTILFISILKSVEIKYGDVSPEKKEVVKNLEETKVSYQFPDPGTVLPGSPLWPLKALRDRIWLLLTTNPSKKADLLLFFADKRLAQAETLFREGEYAEGIATLSKAEKYLEKALIQGNENRKRGLETKDFFRRIAISSLAHFEMMEKFYNFLPDQTRPLLVKNQDYPQKIFEHSRNALLDLGQNPPQNPFSW